MREKWAEKAHVCSLNRQIQQKMPTDPHRRLAPSAIFRGSLATYVATSDACASSLLTIEVFCDGAVVFRIISKLVAVASESEKGNTTDSRA